MARRPIDPYWRERILAIAANGLRLGPGPIATMLRRESATAGRAGAPSERSVSRVLQTFRTMTSEERAPYREFLWPISMERGDVPWEAAPAVFELLRYLHGHILGFPGRRPLTRSVQWFWRVTQAAPEASVDERWNWTSVLVLRDHGCDARLPVLEWRMATGGHDDNQGVWFGEDVGHQPLVDEKSVVMLPELFLEAMVGMPMTRDDALTISRRLQERNQERSQETGVTPPRGEQWQDAQTEKGPSTSEPTAAGAPPSRSRKRGGSTSSAKTARKSRGS